MQNFFTKEYDSDEDDEDYVPEEDIEEEEEEHKKKSTKYDEKRRKKIEDIWEQMKNASKVEKKIEEETIDVTKVKELIEKIKKTQPKPQVIKFAGKTFDLSGDNEYKLLGEGEENNKKDENKPEEAPKQDEPSSLPSMEIQKDRDPIQVTMTLAQKNEYLKSILKVIEAKNINSMTKSKYDWKEYATKTGMEKQFAENRKDGYIEKQKFLEKAKAEEREQMKARKKVKV